MNVVYEDVEAAEARAYAAAMDAAYGAGNWWRGEGGAAVAPEEAGYAHVVLERAARALRAADRAITAVEAACAPWGMEGCFRGAPLFRLRRDAEALSRVLEDTELLRVAVEAAFERACGGDAHARALWEWGVQRAHEELEPS